MSVLKKQVQQRLEAQNRMQKQLAMELIKVEGEKGPAPATVEKNLALLGNDESATKFFFDHQPRLEKLAKELQVEVNALKRGARRQRWCWGPGFPRSSSSS